MLGTDENIQHRQQLNPELTALHMLPFKCFSVLILAV